ncbi:hypothetical protein QFZ28_003107 [Neobacillus niacini]|uniref:hypothetical protein n=1 Tax=Neobacillus niacini TaxID=86668 RepID=UPI00278B918B|nr:hypothetical protein [Neobacillus niacini]MDQ1002707.1 hypothetical protein [Neobacillus niacini]
MTYIEFLIKTEEFVAKRFNNVIIISQVSIPQQRFLSILENFNKILDHSWSIEDNMIKSMWRMAPKTCLYLTVTYAIYHYDGNFWGKFKKAISLQNDHLWKRYFLKTLVKENLVVFDKTSSQKYINNILGHASLPKHNIRSFIGNVIEKGVEYNLEPEEIVAAFNKNSSGNVKTYGIYKSVRDFIRLNNHVSNDVLSRCLEVWKEHNTPFYENYRNFLPDHILQEFDRYVEGQDLKFHNRTTFIKRPFLMYSPENQNVFINLPVQRFPINKYHELRWLIKVDNEEIVINTNISRSTEHNEIEFSVNSKNREYVVKPNTEYEITLLADNELKGEWLFNLTNLTLFNSRTLIQERKDMIPSRGLIAVVYEDILTIVEKGKNPCYIKPLFGAWAGYFEVEIFVKESDTLNFPEKPIYLNPDQITFELVGNLCTNVKSEFSFFNAIPTIHIKKQGKEVDIKSWTIRLSHDWTSYSKTITLKQLDDRVRISNEDISFSLAPLFESIGKPFGKFTLSLTGNLGQDYKNEFILIPNEDFNIEIYDSINDKKNIQIKTVKNIEFSSESVVNIQKSQDNFWHIILNPWESRLKGTIFNNSTFETVNITVFSSPIIAELKSAENIIFPLGEMLNKANFNLKSSFVLIDLENPTVSTKHDFISLFLNEPLRTGEKAQKSYRLKTGRKHLIALDYFDGIHDTYRTRTLFLEIPECQFSQRLLTLETYWKVNQIGLKKSKENFVIDWDISFPPEALQVRVWMLNQFRRPFVQKTVEGSEVSLEIKGIPEGYIMVEMLEQQPNDFFATLFKKDFPKENSDRIKVFKNISQSPKSYTFSKWLLLEDVAGVEYDRTTEELELLLEIIYKNHNLLLPLLLEDYDSCCDFGIQNIDGLLELFETYVDDYDYQQFLYKLIGFQEWDVNSFQNVMKSKFEGTTNLINYVPTDIHKLNNMTTRELFLANQRRRFNEQLLKGFSLEHAFIRHLHDITVETTYREKLNAILDRDLKHIQNLIERLLEKKIIPIHFKSTLNERMIPNAGYLKAFPYLIGITACLTASLLYSESELEEKDRVFIRNISLWMLQEHQEWFLHDLICWKNRFREYETREKAAIERRKKYEHPSFTWKS